MGNEMGGQGTLQEVLVHHEHTDRPRFTLYSQLVINHLVAQNILK